MPILVFAAALIADSTGTGPVPSSPRGQPAHPEKIELGRRLFFDRRLSRDGAIACSSCHDPGAPSRMAAPWRSASSGGGATQRSALINRG